jgi:hypothetical protein
MKVLMTSEIITEKEATAICEAVNNYQALKDRNDELLATLREIKNVGGFLGDGAIGQIINKALAHE